MECASSPSSSSHPYVGAEDRSNTGRAQGLSRYINDVLTEDGRNSDDNVGGIGRIVLRDRVEIDDPLAVVIGFLETYGRPDVGDLSAPASFREPDLRLANRGG